MTSSGATWSLTTRRGDRTERDSDRLPRIELEAWLAGMLLADGCVVRENDRPSAVNLSQAESTGCGELMKALAQSYNRPLRREQRPGNFAPIDRWNIQFRDVPLAWAMSVQWVPLDCELARHYVRGLVDGDGSIGRYGGHLRISMFWRCSQEDVGLYYRSFLDSVGVSYGLVKQTHPTIRGCEVHADAEVLGEHLYSGAEWAHPRKAGIIFQ